MTARERAIIALTRQAPAPGLERQASADTDPGAPRCQICPLLEALGGQPKDLGCQSPLDPTSAAVKAGDGAAAGAQVLAVIHTLRSIPLPMEEVTCPEGVDNGRN